MENIGGYVLDHTTRDPGRWNRLPAGARGPYFVSPLHLPCKDRFLRLVRQQREKSPSCNPLDGREHSIAEIARWIGMTALAVRFVGLGVILGVFELASPWDGRAGEDDREECLRQERFRLKGARPWAKVERLRGHVETKKSRRRPGPWRPRYTRGPRPWPCGISRSWVM